MDNNMSFASELRARRLAIIRSKIASEIITAKQDAIVKAANLPTFDFLGPDDPDDTSAYTSAEDYAAEFGLTAEYVSIFTELDALINAAPGTYYISNSEDDRPINDTLYQARVIADLYAGHSIGKDIVITDDTGAVVCRRTWIPDRRDDSDLDGLAAGTIHFDQTGYYTDWE